MTDKTKRLVFALRNSYGYSAQRDKEAADLIEKLSSDCDTWKERAEIGRIHIDD